MTRIARGTAAGLAAAVLLLPPVSGAGDWSSIRGVGMGRTAASTARGLEGIGINPALLAADDASSFAISVAPVAFHFGSDILTVGTYNRYFTGVETDTGTAAYYLTEADKADILGRFGGDPTGLTAVDVDAGVFGAALHLGDAGSIAFSITERASAFADIPSDYARFLFYGNPPSSAFDFSATDVKASWVREYGVTYARSLPVPEFLTGLRVGVTLKAISGFGYAEVVGFNTTLATDEAGVLSGDVDFRARFAGAKILEDGLGPHLSMFPPAAGSGFGGDVGIAATVGPAFVLGIAVSDIGSVGWNVDVEERVADTSYVIDNPLEEGQREFIENTLTGTVRKGEAFRSPLPTTLRVGAAIAVHTAAGESFPGELLVAAEYAQGFQNVPGATTRPRFSLGAEYRPVAWLPIRTGLTAGGYDGFAVALGIGFVAGPVALDVATGNFTSLFAGDEMSHGSVALGLGMRF